MRRKSSLAAGSLAPGTWHLAQPSLSRMQVCYAHLEKQYGTEGHVGFRKSPDDISKSESQGTGQGSPPSV